MKVKLDENLPAFLCDILTALGYQADTVLDEGYGGADDDRIWAAAQEEGRLLVTQDMDFSDFRKFVFHPHNGIVLVRLREPNRAKLIRRLQNVFETEDVRKWPGCFVIVTDHKVRVRRPSKVTDQ
jgi:predicted nuclease of predicted toxin-antitoxin system